MKNLFAFLILMLLSGHAQALKQEDLLPPDKAFKLSAQALSEDRIQLIWDIADGYYMYRKRFAFESRTKTVKLDTNAALFPESILKQDPNLGPMQVYYGQVVIEVPIERSAQAAAALKLKVQTKFQGCAEAGLCYPPQRKRATLTLASLQEPITDISTNSDENPTSAEVVPLASLKARKAEANGNTAADEVVPLTSLKAGKAEANGNTAAAEVVPLASLKARKAEANDDTSSAEVVPLTSLKARQAATNGSAPTAPITETTTANEIDGGDEEVSPKLLSKLSRITANKEPLPVDQAFRYRLTASDKNTLNARWDITPEHNLYRTKISFRVLSPSETELGTPEFPEGKIVDDEFFGEMEIYDQGIDVAIPLKNNQAEQIIVETRYQGCSLPTSICYPPVTRKTTLSLAGLPETAAAASAEDTTSTQASSQTDEFFSGSFLGTLLAFFVVGLGLSLTPCIFPMIPILSGIIAGQSNLSAYKAFILSLTYVLASASAYALIGLVFGFFGENLQSSLQHPIAIASFSALFVILALSMFGFFDLQMPNSIQSRLNEISNNQRSGSLLGAAIMGFLSTLIVGPCVAPALAAALTYIANSKDAVLGASALFSMGFGMGIILLVVGTLGGHLIPRAGSWMDTTKAIFGIMLLGMAIWMLDRIVPIGITMFLSGVLLVSSGIYMGALDKLNEEAGGWGRFWKSIGLIMLFYGSAQLLGVAAGSSNILQPLKGIFAVTTLQGTAAQSEAQQAIFQRVKTNEDMDKALATAARNKKLVLIDFYADWCVDCVRMEKEAFSDPTVKSDLKDVTLLKVDVTKYDEEDKKLEKRFAVIGEPTIIFINRDGNEIKNLRRIGYENTQAFQQRVKQFISH